MGTRSAGKPSIPEAQAKRVVAAMKWLRETRYDSDTALGEALGRSQPAVSNILLNKSKASLDTATRVAGLLGVEVWALLRGEWSPNGVPSSVPTSPFAIGAGAALLDGAKQQDVDVVAARPDAKDPALTWQRAYILVAHAHTDRLLGLAKFPGKESVVDIERRRAIIETKAGARAKVDDAIDGAKRAGAITEEPPEADAPSDAPPRPKTLRP